LYIVLVAVTGVHCQLQITGTGSLRNLAHMVWRKLEAASPSRGAYRDRDLLASETGTAAECPCHCELLLLHLQIVTLAAGTQACSRLRALASESQSERRPVRVLIQLQVEVEGADLGQLFGEEKAPGPTRKGNEVLASPGPGPSESRCDSELLSSTVTVASGRATNLSAHGRPPVLRLNTNLNFKLKATRAFCTRRRSGTISRARGRHVQVFRASRCAYSHSTRRMVPLAEVLWRNDLRAIFDLGLYIGSCFCKPMDPRHWPGQGSLQVRSRGLRITQASSKSW
jgi:hypothetical protein